MTCNKGKSLWHHRMYPQTGRSQNTPNLQGKGEQFTSGEGGGQVLLRHQLLYFTAEFFQFGSSNGFSLFPVWKSSSPCRAAQEHDAARVTASPEPSTSAYYLNASHSPHCLVKHQESAVTLTPSPNTFPLPLPSRSSMTDALAKH